MAVVALPPIEFLRECFSYDPETGEFRWRKRPISHFPTEQVWYDWNARYACTRTFTGAEPDGGYLRAQVHYEGRRYRLRAHRVAYKLMTGEEPPMIDHRDRDTQNNRFANLRPATDSQNQMNRPQKKSSKLPKCVALEGGRYRAYGRLNGRKINLGLHDTPIEAHMAWRAFAEPLHGEFLNSGNAHEWLFA